MEKHHRPREEDHKTREKLQSYAGDYDIPHNLIQLNRLICASTNRLLSLALPALCSQ